MPKAIIDTQLPPKLVQYLQQKGWDAIHTTDFDEGHLLADRAIYEIASLQNRIIITKDSDFFDFYLAKGSPPKVLLLSFGNITNRDLLAQFETHLVSITDFFETGADLVIFGFNGIVQY